MMGRKKKKQNGGGIFGSCFGFNRIDEPPEIQFDIDNNATVAPIALIENDLPMPSPTELKALFTEYVDELDLPAQNRQAMFELTAEKQWQLYCNQKKEQDDPNKLATSWPDYYIDRLNTMSTIMVLIYDDEEIEMRLKLVDSLKTALRTQPLRFVTRFTELDGLSCILNFLKNMAPEVRESRIHTSVIGCIKALMNNTQGRAIVLAHVDAINLIAQSLSCKSLRTKTAVLEILGALCLVPGGHKKVLEGILHYQSYANERTRFQSIINELGTSHEEDDGHEINLKTAIMSFLNALINCGGGEDHLEFRCHIRYELLLLGIQLIMDQLRSYDNELLDKHLDFFEIVRREDEEEIASRFNETHIDTKSASDMFEFIQKKLCYTEGYPNFLSLLHHCILLPLNRNGVPHHWKLFDRIVQQITLQKMDGSDPDVSFLRDFNVENCLKLLINEDEIEKWKETAETMSKKHDSMKTQLDRKERECEAKTREKEELMETLNLIKSKLDSTSKEKQNSEQELQRVNVEADSLRKSSLSNNEEYYSEPPIENFYNVIADTEQENQKLQNVIRSGNLSSDINTSTSIPPPPSVGIVPPPPTGGNIPPPPMGGIPPPPMGGIPPPPMGGIPPPPMGGIPPPPMGGIPPPPMGGIPPPPMGGVPPPPMGGIPPPPMGGVPPPPMRGIPPPNLGFPPAIGGFNAPAKTLPAKNTPKSSVPMKSFNWSKIAENNITGTIWSEIDDTKAFKLIDLSEMEVTFSAFQKKQDATATPLKKLEGEDDSSKKVKELSVIDGRRAQNCTILLSKLKLADEDIKHAVLSCDQSEDLPIDMLEQLMKFIPSKEEIDMLNEHKADIHRMARADKFFLEMNKIHHYDQRLQALFYKKKFNERMSDLKPKVESLQASINEVRKSKRLKKVLEMVLAFGNYMNKGQRGNAYGFKLQSLNKIIDTKSSANRNVSLMNFLITMLEKNAPDYLKLPDDLKHVDEAAKISISEMDKDMGIIRIGLKKLKSELEVQQKRVSNKESNAIDRFVPVMTDFVTVATFSFSQLEEQLTEAKSKFEKVATLFGEDSKRMPPDQFFGLFASFVGNFEMAKKDNLAAKKKREEEEKRKKIEQQRELTKNKNKKQHGSIKQRERGEFDDLVSALRTGEVFDKDGGKFQKRNRARQPINSINNMRER